MINAILQSLLYIVKICNIVSGHVPLKKIILWKSVTFTVLFKLLDNEMEL